MKAVEISTFGAPEVLTLVDRPMPVPGVGELLIRVSASGINRPDVLQRTGHYPVPAGASDIPGLEVAGVIEQGDLQELMRADFKLGDRVCALVSGGGYAKFCVAPVVQCLPVPKGLSDVEAASLPETFFTVWSNVFDRVRLQKGETLLIQGGSSGIGVTAIQLAKAFGANVIVTAGTDEKCAACVALGADPLTFQGLAGVGDLVATCHSPLSRNRTFGLNIGRGLSVEQTIEVTKQTCEGFKSCQPILALAQAYGVDMPITEQVVEVVHHGRSPRTLAAAFMARDTKREIVSERPSN